LLVSTRGTGNRIKIWLFGYTGMAQNKMSHRTKCNFSAVWIFHLRLGHYARVTHSTNVLPNRKTIPITYVSREVFNPHSTASFNSRLLLWTIIVFATMFWPSSGRRARGDEIKGCVRVGWRSDTVPKRFHVLRRYAYHRGFTCGLTTYRTSCSGARFHQNGVSRRSGFLRGSRRYRRAARRHRICFDRLLPHLVQWSHSGCRLRM